MSLIDLLSTSKIIPVVTPYSVESTVKLAHALQAGGMNAIEITLRDDCAMDAIKAVIEAGTGLQVGVGTICSEADVEKIAALGLDFAVSPGTTPKVLQAANDAKLALLPGISSASELMVGLEYGLDFFKLFPAEAVGGIALLKSFYGPFSSIKFCPTGGINVKNINSYLELPNVVCAGGSWMVSKDLVLGEKWDTITQQCESALFSLR